MGRMPMPKLSLIGLLLLAVSAITGAVMPKDKTNKEKKAINSLTYTTFDLWCLVAQTCVTTNSAVVQCQRTNTLYTTTTDDSVDVTSIGLNDISTFLNGGDGSTNAGGAPHPNTSKSPC